MESNRSRSVEALTAGRTWPQAFDPSSALAFVAASIALAPTAWAVAPPAEDPLVQGRHARVVAPDAAPQDVYGFAVAIDGDILASSSLLDDDGPSESGSVYVYERVGSGWALQTKLTAPDPSSWSDFGHSVSLSGETLAVGSNLDDEAALDAGSVYVFVRRAGVWSFEAKLIAQDGESKDAFGGSVAISGDRLLIGARNDDDGGLNAGAVYIFERSGTVWTRAAKLHPPDLQPGDFFGRKVALDGDRALVSAAYGPQGELNGGRAYVYARQGENWLLETMLVAADGAAGDTFGNSLGISGPRLVIGAARDTIGSQRLGSAYVFELGPAGWQRRAKLLAQEVDPQNDELFGNSVAISGALILVGAPGANAAFLFRSTPGGWSRELRLNSAERVELLEDRYGYSCDLAGDTMVVGAISDNLSGTNSGAAYATTVCREPGTAFCFGDGTEGPCPCGNVGRDGSACKNSSGLGMRIHGCGTASVQRDDLEIITTNCPPGTLGIYVVGTDSVQFGIHLFDGLRCVDGDVRSMGGVIQRDGTARMSDFVARDAGGGYFAPGSTYYFQLLTRDPISTCGTNLNLSPGYAVTLRP